MDASMETDETSNEEREMWVKAARERPRTNAAKCILAYEEKREMQSLAEVLQAVSKNLHFFGDPELLLSYYIKEFVGLAGVGRLATSDFVYAASVVQYLGEIYAARVDSLHEIAQKRLSGIEIARDYIMKYDTTPYNFDEDEGMASSSSALKRKSNELPAPELVDAKKKTYEMLHD